MLAQYHVNHGTLLFDLAKCFRGMLEGEDLRNAEDYAAPPEPKSETAGDSGSSGDARE